MQQLIVMASYSSNGLEVDGNEEFSSGPNVDMKTCLLSFTLSAHLENKSVPSNNPYNFHSGNFHSRRLDVNEIYDDW